MQSGVSSERTYGQELTGHFLSANTVLHKTLNDDCVPLLPRVLQTEQQRPHNFSFNGLLSPVDQWPISSLPTWAKPSHFKSSKRETLSDRSVSIE